jgi:hypothetical protein
MGGKDRHPFPVPTKIYDQTIKVLKAAIDDAKLGREESLGAICRLDEQARCLERHVDGPSVEDYVADELQSSHVFGGRSVFGWEPDSQIGRRPPNRTAPVSAPNSAAR